MFANIEGQLLETVIEKAKELAPNNHLRDAIVGRIDNEGNDINVVVEVPITPSTRDAAAYEYGSGIHSSDPHTIPIEGRPLLVFPWDKAEAGIPRTKDGRVILAHVEHPGVEAANNGRGYLHAAIEDSFPQVASIVAIETGKNLLDKVKNIFAGLGS